MATVTELPELDSGVASPETTPEGQIGLGQALGNSDSKKSTLAGKSDSCNNIKKSGMETIVDSTISSKSENKGLSLLRDITRDDASAVDDDDFYDESIAERLWGLTEMFPTSVRSTASCLTQKTSSFIKSVYQLSRQIIWVGVSTSVILLAPVMFELERFNVEEMVKQDRNRLVLGPGSAMSGPGPMGPSSLPPPPTR